jgi:hypothetical protein
MATGQCPECLTDNEYSYMCCTMCGARLPWAPTQRVEVPSRSEIQPIEPQVKQEAVSQKFLFQLGALGLFFLFALFVWPEGLFWGFALFALWCVLVGIGYVWAKLTAGNKGPTHRLQ